MNDPLHPQISCRVGSTIQTRQPRAQRTQAAILATAAEHFDAIGYAQTTGHDIIGACKFTKGALYFHFPSKAAIAQHLAQCWVEAVEDAVASTVDAHTSALEQLAAVYRYLAFRIAHEVQLRAGLKLTLEASVDNSAAFTRWVEAISDIVEMAIVAGDLIDTPATHRLAWNLCAGTVGTTHATATLCEDIDLAMRLEDTFNAHLSSALAPKALGKQHNQDNDVMPRQQELPPSTA